MTTDPIFNSGDSSHSKEVDCVLYQEILRSLAEILRKSDFTSYVGGISFLMDLTNETYCDQTNQKSLERSTELVTALSYVVLTLLDQHDDPNVTAEEVARIVDEAAREMPATLEIPDIAHMEFQVCMDGSEGVVMSFDELVDRLELPVDDFVLLTQDLSLLESGTDVETIFRQVDGLDDQGRTQ